MRKKAIICIAAVLCFVLSACGADNPPLSETDYSPYVGVYYCEGDGGEWIELSADGGWTDSAGLSGRFTVDNRRITLTAGSGESMSGTIRNGVLNLGVPGGAAQVWKTGGGAPNPTPSYTVYYATGTDEGLPPLTAEAGGAIAAPASPVREGYKFTGWFETVSGAPFEFDVMPDKDVYLTAGWDRGYKISFNTGVSGVSMEPIYETAGALVREPSPPSVRNYRFLNWLINGGDFTFSGFRMPARDIEIAARWQYFEQTNLPAVFIDVPAGLSAVDNGKDRDIQYPCEVGAESEDGRYRMIGETARIKGRGNGSWGGGGAKNSYKLKFDSKAGFLGQTPNKHWVLHSATANSDYGDTSMLKNYMAFELGRELFDGIPFVTSSVFIDLYFNGGYHGVYILTEHTRVDEKRVDIASKNGAAGTGFLVEYDRYSEAGQPERFRNYRVYPPGQPDGLFISPQINREYFTVNGYKWPFVVKSPDPDEMFEGGIAETAYGKQTADIKAALSEVLAAALDSASSPARFDDFKRLANVDSFVDMYILHEFFKNTDTGFSSFFLARDARTAADPNPKVFCVAPWDFDFTAGVSRNDSDYRNIYVGWDGVCSDIRDPKTYSELFVALTQNTEFFNRVAARWHTLAPEIGNFIDTRLSNGFFSDYRYAMGRSIGLWDGKSQAAGENAWLSAATDLRNWLLNRENWLSNTGIAARNRNTGWKDFRV
ncbi:MAG: CotH kinase family protein [Clostridiales bacterium]|jgi:uncharacterized repeat protein (TIGR02543 family)|nr:CotH kinase family protein [Clostridiales bacterium]